MTNTVRTIASVCFAAFLFSCNKPEDPKEVSVAFIQNINAHEFDEAAALATADTKDAVLALKNDALLAQPVEGADETALATFATDALQPFVSSNSAIVKNDIVSLNLKKVDGDWLVVANKETVDGIVYRTQRMQAVKMKWEDLKGQYNRRTELLKEYISYVKSGGKESAEAANLEAAINNLPLVEGEPTKEGMLAYIRAQQAIEELADKALQPTLTASADLTMNYIINIQTQATRISEAKTEYNKAATEAQSDKYAVLP